MKRISPSIMPAYTESDIQKIHPDLRLKISRRAKRIAIRMNSQTRQFDLVVPAGMKSAYIMKFARDNIDWINKQKAHLPAPIPFTDGQILPIFGQEHTLRFTSETTSRNQSIAIENKTIFVNDSKGDPAARIKRFLKQLCMDEIKILVADKAQKANLKYNRIYVRDARTRWGSCSTDGNLSFSWRLIFAPYDSFDYLIAHEVAHLRHMNHSKQFWALCEDLCTEYKTGKKWIRSHGHTLMKYGIPDKIS